MQVPAVGKDGLPSQLAGKVVGLYFSAHWCPPCRAFTPTLAAAYRDAVRASSAFEIVFVSSDRDPASFNAYYATMPWARVPFESAAVRSALSAQYAIRGIPALLLFDTAGKLITREGVKLVQAGGLGGVLVRAPRRPFADLMASIGVGGGGNVLLYFSPQAAFDAVLLPWSAAHPEARVVCIGRAADFRGAGSPWPVLPPGTGGLAEACGVGDELALVLVDGKGAILRQSKGISAADAAKYASEVLRLTQKARHVVRDLDPKNDLELMRLRAKDREILAAPGDDFLVIIVQKWRAASDEK